MAECPPYWIFWRPKMGSSKCRCTTSYRLSMKTSSKLLSFWENRLFRGPIMVSLKSPCTTSYMSSIETIALTCLVFEKIAFLQFGNRQTNKETNRQTNRRTEWWTRPLREAALAVASGGLIKNKEKRKSETYMQRKTQTDIQIQIYRVKWVDKPCTPTQTCPAPPRKSIRNTAQDRPVCSTTINPGSSMDYPELTIAPQTERRRTTPLTGSDDKRNTSIVVWHNIILLRIYRGRHKS